MCTHDNGWGRFMKGVMLCVGNQPRAETTYEV